MVLAAGLGTRLLPLTENVAKPALPFVGVPVLCRVLDALGEAGVGEACVNLHHAPESVRAAVEARGSRPPRVRFSDETAQLLGTAGALIPVKDWLAEAPVFLLLNGDCIHAIDLASLLRAHAEGGASATLVTRSKGERGFGALLVDEAGRVTAFGVKAEGRPEERHFLSVQAVSPALLDLLPETPCAWNTFTDWYPLAASKGHVFRVHESDAEWHGVDSSALYLAATREWLARRGAECWIDERASIVGTAEIVGGSAVHEGCVVQAGARLIESVLLPGARVGAGAHLTRCLVGPGAVVPEGSREKDAILSRRPA